MDNENLLIILDLFSKLKLNVRDLDENFKMILGTCCNVIEEDNGYLFVLENGTLTNKASKPVAYKNESLCLSKELEAEDGVFRWVMSKKESYVGDPFDNGSTKGIMSVLVVPVIHNYKINGILYFYSYIKDFDRSHQILVEIVAAYASVVIEEHYKTKSLQKLPNILEGINKSPLDLASTLTHIKEIACEVTGADEGCLWEFKDDEDHPEPTVPCSRYTGCDQHCELRTKEEISIINASSSNSEIIELDFNSPEIHQRVSKELISIHQADHIVSELVLPLRYLDKTQGFLHLHNYKKSFTNEQVNSLKIISDPASNAIGKSRLYEEMSSAVHGFYRISRNIRTENITILLRIVLVESLKLVNSKRGSVMIIDNRKNKLVTIASEGLSEVEKNASLKLGDDIIGWVAQKGEIALVPDVDKDHRLNRKYHNTIVKSLLSIPLMDQNEIIGVLSVDGLDIEGFNTRHKKLLEILAHHASLAIQLNEERTLNIKEIRANQNIEEASFSADYDVVAKSIVDNAKDLLDSSDGDLYTYNKLQNSLFLSYPKQRTSKEKEVDSNVADVAEFKNFYFTEKELIVPLRHGQVLLGVLHIYNPKFSLYNMKHKKLLCRLSKTVMQAIESINMAERVRGKERLAALGDLRFELGHQIKTPLFTIQNAANVLKDLIESGHGSNSRQWLDSSEISQRQVRTILETVKNIDDKLDDLRKLFVLQKLNISTANVQNIIDETIDQIDVRFSVENAPTVVKYYSKEVPEIRTDINQLKDAFTNIIINAIEATTDGGKLIITTLFLPAEELPILVSFKDCGIGIQEEDQDKIFDKFFTTKSGGTGLGLSICISIIHNRLGGEISYSSETGKGTTFTIRLPIDNKSDI